MRKTIALVLALVMIMSLATVYADAFTPPGQAKKNTAGQLTQQQTTWNEADLEEGWGPLGLPFVLMGKMVPPGLVDKGGLPPGLFGRAFDELPPGIQMRFMHTMQERVRVEDPLFEETMVVDNLEDLMDALEDENIRRVLLEERIVIDEDTTIDGNFKTIRYLSEADINKMEAEDMDVDDLDAFDDDWLFEVEDGAELTLRDVKLVGDGEDGDIGLVKVEADAELTTFKVWFSKAHTGVKIYVDEDVEDLTSGELADLVDDVDEMAKEIIQDSQNIFEQVKTSVLVVDENNVDIVKFWDDEE